MEEQEPFKLKVESSNLSAPTESEILNPRYLPAPRQITESVAGQVYKQDSLIIPFLHSGIVVKKEWFDNLTERKVDVVVIKIRNAIYDILKEACRSPVIDNLSKELYTAAFSSIQLEINKTTNS